MRRRAALVLLLLSAAAPPAAGDAPAPELDVLVNTAIGVTRLSSSELAEIFSGSRRTWAAGKAIVAFNLPAKNPLRVEFDRLVLAMSPDEVGRFWIDQRIRGGSPPPRQVDDPAVLARLVARMPGAIGYAPVGAAATLDVRVVARIRGHKVITP